MSEWDKFKLDGLIVRDNPRSFVFMVNFNVPFRHLNQGIDSKLETIKTCVEGEFVVVIATGDLYFSISATYNLEHKETGEVRLWQGSFQPRNNRNLLLSDYKQYSPDSFLALVKESIDPGKIAQHLTWAGLDSKWTFSELKSVIVSFQSRCSVASHTFAPNSLIVPAHRLRDVAVRGHVQFQRLLE